MHVATTEPRTTAILEATLQLIGESGLESVTHRSAAAAAGVSLGAVTHHFKSREKLLEATLTFAARREIERLERAALDLATAETLDDWIAGAMEALTEDPVIRLASYEFLLASARYDRYRALMGDWHAAHMRIATLGVRVAGSSAVQRDATIVVAWMSGAMLKQLAYPDDEQDLVGQLRVLVLALQASA